MTTQKKDDDGAKKSGSGDITVPVSPVSDMATEEVNETGSIRISDNVIAAIVRRYTADVPGVVRFASGSIVSGLTEMLSKKNVEGSVVRVEVDDDTVSIAVKLVLEFGVRIREVATMVQDVIRSRVEELTGNHVARVDVIVQDLEDVSKDDAQDQPGEGTQE